MNKFKEGDRVRSENTGYSYMIKMTEGIVVRTPGYEGGLYEVKVISGIFRDEWNKEYFTNTDFWSFTEFELEPLFKVGDEVERIGDDNINFRGDRIRVGCTYTISKIDADGWLYLKGCDNFGTSNPSNFKLIKGGSTMCGSGYAKEKSLRDRIEALTGWNKEADDILQEIFKKGVMCGGEKVIRIVVDNFVDCSTGYISLVGHGTYVMEGATFQGKIFKSFDVGSSQCSKLRAFKDALLWLLNKSGLEKVDKEKDELLKQIAELKSHHEQEGQKIKEMEDKVNGGNR